MRVLQVYNQQRSLFGGEENVVNATVNLLRRRGIDVRLALKCSRGLEASAWRKTKAAASGFYNPFSRAEIAHLIRAFQPDILHAHNIFPTWSPSIFGAAKAAGVATVMSVHSQILTCPTWYHFREGKICEECVGGREYRCVVNRCRGSLAESLIYAGRGFFVRSSGILIRNIDVFVAMSEFMRTRLVASGIAEHHIAVVPNSVPRPAKAAVPARNRYIAFSGRLSREKGVETLLAVSRRLPDVAFKCAGDGPMATLLDRRPANLDFVGRLTEEKLAAFYRDARAVFVPSIAYETFSMTTLEAMAHGVPVIASAIGAIPELVGDDAGLLFPAGDAETAIERITRVWSDDALCASLGQKARVRSSVYSEDAQAERLMLAYRVAMGAGQAGIRPTREQRHAV